MTYITKKDYKNFITCKFYWQLEQPISDGNFFDPNQKMTFARKAYSLLLDQFEVVNEEDSPYIKEGLEFDLLVKDLIKNQYPTIDLNDEQFLSLSIQEKAKITKEQILKKENKFIINGWFIYQDMVCNPDLIEIIDRNKIILIEIKARTKPDKKRDVADLAFQYNLISKNKLIVENVKLILSNSNFFYTEKNNYHGVYKEEEYIKINRVLLPLISVVQEQAINVSKIVLQIRNMSLKNQKQPIPCKLHKKCNIDGVYCKYFKFCAEYINKLDIGPNSLINFYGLKFYKKIKLLNSRQYKFTDYRDFDHLLISLEEKSNYSKQYTVRKLQYLSVTNNEDQIDSEIIKKKILKYKFPIYMLDFETFSSIIPKVLYSSPYQQVPFLYSIHIIRSLDEIKNPKPIFSNLVNKSYIVDPENFDLVGFIFHLCEDLQVFGQGTIVAYHATFEKSVIKKLLDSVNYFDLKNIPNNDLYFKNIDFLKSIVETDDEKIFDLKDFFSEGGFYRKIFNGKLSIKSVLPAIDENFSYKALNVQNGVEASSSYLDLLTLKNISFSEKTKKLKDLVKYCKFDTLAMVVIFNFLYFQS